MNKPFVIPYSDTSSISCQFSKQDVQKAPIYCFWKELHLTPQSSLQGPGQITFEIRYGAQNAHLCPLYL